MRLILSIYIIDSIIMIPWYILATAMFHLRMLDYNTGIPQLASKYGNLPPGTRFGFNDVVCAGTEESLLDCPHTQVLTFK